MTVPNNGARDLFEAFTGDNMLTTCRYTDRQRVTQTLVGLTKLAITGLLIYAGAGRLARIGKGGKAPPPRGRQAPKKPPTPSQQKSIGSYRKRIAEHQAKLDAYRRNPAGFDNKGLLKNAPNDAVRQRIIDGRIKHLEKEIGTFQENIRKIEGGN